MKIIYIPLPHAKRLCFDPEIRKLIKHGTIASTVSHATHLLVADLTIDQTKKGKGRATYVNFRLEKLK